MPPGHGIKSDEQEGDMPPVRGEPLSDTALIIIVGVILELLLGGTNGRKQD